MFWVTQWQQSPSAARSPGSALSPCGSLVFGRARCMAQGAVPRSEWGELTGPSTC